MKKISLFIAVLAMSLISYAVPANSVEIVGIVKRAVQLGESTIILTHEDNVAHIYNVVDGVATEVSQDGVVAIDPENAGSYLAISDIAVTEDGKLVANNYVRCQFGTTAPETGYKKGTSYYYIWNDIAGAPSVWFTSQTTARSSHGDVGYTFALKGTSQNAEILVTAVHNNNRAVRMSLHKVIDGVYVDPDYISVYDNEYYINFGVHTTSAYYIESAQGKQFQLNASATAGKWYLEGELSEPTEFMVPGVGESYSASGLLADGTLGKKYNGATILSTEDTEVMVAPYADADGKLAGVKILDITNGLAAAEELQVLALDAPVEATAAATAVEIPEDEDAMYIYLVADATIYTLKAVSEEEEYYDVVVENAVATEDGMNIVVTGTWAGREVAISLWQGGGAQGYGTYSATENEGEYNGWIMNPFVMLMPVSDAVYADNGDGTFTLTAMMTDYTDDYKVTMTGATNTVQIADYITIDNTAIYKEGLITNFVGYNDAYDIDLTLFGQEYGEYRATVEDGETIYPIEGYINDDVAFVGEGVYSFSDEYNSDLLVATIYVPADDIYYEVTMYTKPLVATDVLIMENMTKEIIESRWNTNLQLSGVHETYGDVVITIAGCDGTYGEYAVTATVGDLELEGQGAWQNDGDVDVLNAMLQNADASRVFNVSVSTPYVEAPEPETIVVEVEDALFEETEDGLVISGTSAEGQELYLLVGEWAAAGYGMYTEFGAVVGTIDGVEVTIMGEDQYAGIEKDEDRAILSAVLTDGTNIYEISAYGTAPGTTTGIDNISTTVAPVKIIENGQLIIINSDIKYNAQGAVIK